MPTLNRVRRMRLRVLLGRRRDDCDPLHVRHAVRCENYSVRRYGVRVVNSR